MFVNGIFYYFDIEIDLRGKENWIGSDAILQQILWGSLLMSLIKIFQYITIILLF